MVRPRGIRHVSSLPTITYYKPQGIQLSSIGEIVLTIEEFESLKLKDYLGKSENESSESMKISQPTFNRLYNNAKKKLIKAIVEGLAIKIEGGNYKMPNRDGTGPRGMGQNGNRRNFGAGQGRGLGRNTQNFGIGSGGTCKCPNCDYEITHNIGNPCYTLKCPNCNVNLIRK